MGADGEADAAAHGAVTPALSAEEWAESEFNATYGRAKTSFHIDHKGRCCAHSVMPDETRDVVVLNEAVDAPVVRLKLAALALHDQPFGFTREDVKLVQSLARGSSCDDGRHYLEDGEAEQLESVAGRIAALLPPVDAGEA